MVTFDLRVLGLKQIRTKHQRFQPFLTCRYEHPNFNMHILKKIIVVAVWKCIAVSAHRYQFHDCQMHQVGQWFALELENPHQKK